MPTESGTTGSPRRQFGGDNGVTTQHPETAANRSDAATHAIGALGLETPNSRKQPQLPARNHNPRVGGSSPSSGIACLSGMRRPQAAIPAKNRSAAALTQEELLDVAARMVIGPDAGAEDLVRAIFEDMAGVTERASETVWRSSQQLQSRWTPFPASASP